MGFVIPAIAGLLTPLIGAAAATFVATAVTQLAVAALLGAVTQKKQATPNQEDVAAELQQTDGLPAYRFAYGNCKVPGTPAPADVTKGAYLYGCWLLNSRPSVGDFTLYLDDREVELTGDPYDFSETGGATATNAPFALHTKVWFGRGDQTEPPAQILSEVPFEEGVNDNWFKSTDGWQGRTVVWLRLYRGSGNVQSRWPTKPPAISVRNLRSACWDPRDGAQDPDDASTWSATENSSLITLDALMRSPVAPYKQANLMLDMFKWAADVADEQFETKGGGTEARYPAGGVLTFKDSELEDQLQPLLDAGGAQWIRVGGRLGIVPATWHDPVYTLTDLIGSEYEFRALKRGKDLYKQVRTFYTSADREFETSELGLWDIPGAANDGQVLEQRLTFVGSGTQAQRLRKIAGLRALQPRSLKSVAPPDMINVLPGANVTVILPGRTRINGTYQAASLHPAADPVGSDGGVALRMPFEITSTSPTIFAWDKDTDEEDILVTDFDSSFQDIDPPGPISVITGPSVDLNTGGTIIPRVRFAFDPSGTSNVDSYIWEYTDWLAVGDVWVSGGTIDSEVRGDDDKVFDYFAGMSYADTTSIRVAARRGEDLSDYVQIDNVRLNLDVTIDETLALGGQVRFNVTTPNNSNFNGLSLWRSDDDDFENAVAITGTKASSKNISDYVRSGTGGDDGLPIIALNGDFADGTIWTLGTNWTISGGTAAHTIDTPASAIEQPISVADGDTLRWMLTVNSISKGSATVRVFGDSNVDGTVIDSVGVHHGTITAPTNTTGFGIQAATDSDIEIDDVTLVVDAAGSAEPGPGYFWVVPHTINDSVGPAVGPVLLNIP